MRHRGLTLVELLVVLTILVALTTVAIRATEGTLQQSRYDATVRTLQAIEEAVTSDSGRSYASGEVAIRGFVADMGRLPKIDSAGNNELLSLPSTAQPFQPWEVADDLDIRLASGWNGPYLRSVPGAGPGVRDGWGNPIRFLLADKSTEAGPDQTFVFVSSFGADASDDGGSSPSNPFDRDFAPIDLGDRTVNLSLRFRVEKRGSGGNPPEDPDPLDGRYVAVFLYGPGESGISESRVLLDLTPTPPDLPEYSGEFLSSHVGSFALRAYQGVPASGSTDEEQADDLQMTSMRKSRVEYVVVPRGGRALDVVLVLP